MTGRYGSNRLTRLRYPKSARGGPKHDAGVVGHAHGCVGAVKHAIDSPLVDT